jgi:DNA polymerase-3 subunit gamma/tau
VAAPAAGDLDAAALRRVWPDALDRVKAGSKTTWAMLDGAQITEVSGSTIVLAVAPSLAKRIAEERHSSLIASAVGQLITGNWRVSVVANATAPAAIKSAALSVPATSSSEPDPRDDPDFDPTPAPSAPIDPEAEALRLLQDRLGARPVE